MAREYRVVTGMNYPPYGKGHNEVRAEPGDVVANLPPAAIAGLLEQGVIREQPEGGDG